ncbi:3-dehydroquinate synthase [Candidatus Micrarchaeota archaeon]|nr:3-dehydroquinate synthase [Candidatus Micrarchaeota archaeon]
MRTMTLQAPSGACKIALGESIGNLKGYCGGADKIVAITDSNVRRLHGEKLGGMESIAMEPGEAHKTLETAEAIYARLLELEADRSSFIVGVGGGIVCDVAGFVASTYMRGVRFGFVPTTLLAQVDASVGGKNGINFRGYKNIIGTIRQPEFCICDFSLLGTLPKEELRNGFAEAVKTAAIGDASLFSFLEGNWDSAFALQRAAIEKVVHDSLQVKMRIVSADEGEKGQRMKLNFGHTIGHAIEKAAGIPHGEAISIGMVAAANLSRKKAGLDAKEAQGLEKLLKEIGLPTHLGAKKAEVLEAIRKDKKRYGAKIRMILLERIGSARMADVGLGEMEGVVNDMC